MPTIRDDTTRAQLVQRLRAVRPDRAPEFGTLDAPRMLCHLADQVRVALGSMPSHERRGLLRLAPVRWLALRLPIPKGRLGTVREMLATSPGEFDADRHALEELLTELARAETTAPHPVFGPLTPAAWGRLTWKHFDHHLRQFGA